MSSRFHRFFLKNVSPFETNTRIMRIGNVIQASPHPFVHGYQAIPQYQQNNLVPFSLPSSAPSPAPYNPYHMPSSSYASFPQQTFSQNPHTLYSYAQQFPPKNFFPTATAYSPSPSPFPPHPRMATGLFPLQHSPVRSFYKFGTPSPTPYAFEQFAGPEKTGVYPFQRLNAGESLPQLNLNFGLHNEVYRPNRFARHPQNATSYQ